MKERERERKYQIQPKRCSIHHVGEERRRDQRKKNEYSFRHYTPSRTFTSTRRQHERRILISNHNKRACYLIHLGRAVSSCIFPFRPRIPILFTNCCHSKKHTHTQHTHRVYVCLHVLADISYRYSLGRKTKRKQEETKKKIRC